MNLVMRLVSIIQMSGMRSCTPIGYVPSFNLQDDDIAAIQNGRAIQSLYGTLYNNIGVKVQN